MTTEDRPRTLLEVQESINNISDYDSFNPSRDDWSLGRVFLPMRTGVDNWLISSESVRRVMIPGEIILVPDARPCVRGITHLSGVVYTVLDLNRIRRMKGIGSDEDVKPSVRTRLVFIERKESPVALLVERARDVVSININSIKSAAVSPSVSRWIYGGDANALGGFDLVINHIEMLRDLDDIR